MPDGLIDPLLLGQRVVAILETGLRTATYKLATITALIDQCIEHLPDDPDAPLSVPIPELAHRVLEIYGRQVRPFNHVSTRLLTHDLVAHACHSRETHGRPDTADGLRLLDARIY